MYYLTIVLPESLKTCFTFDNNNNDPIKRHFRRISGWYYIGSYHGGWIIMVTKAVYGVCYFMLHVICMVSDISITVFGLT